MGSCYNLFWMCRRDELRKIKIKACQGRLCALMERRGLTKGRLGMETTANYSIAYLVPDLLSCTYSFEYVIQSVFWSVRIPFPRPLLIFLWWLPMNPRNQWHFHQLLAALVWIPLFSRALTFLNTAFIFFISPVCQPMQHNNQKVVLGSKVYVWYRVPRTQYKYNM